MNNNILFKENEDLIRELCLKNWIPSEIAKIVGMDRHAMINRIRKFGFKLNKRSNFIINNNKVCSNCRIEKSIDQFAKNYNKYSSRCKSCRKLYLENRKEASILHQLRSNAKKKGHEFNLTLEDIVIPEYCPILGVKLDSAIYRYSPSVDRIDSSKGYIKGNIQIISTKANNMKNDASPEELLAFSKYYIKNKKENV